MSAPSRNHSRGRGARVTVRGAMHAYLTHALNAARLFVTSWMLD